MKKIQEKGEYKYNIPLSGPLESRWILFTPYIWFLSVPVKFYPSFWTWFSPITPPGSFSTTANQWVLHSLYLVFVNTKGFLWRTLEFRTELKFAYSWETNLISGRKGQGFVFRICSLTSTCQTSLSLNKRQGILFSESSENVEQSVVGAVIRFCVSVVPG